MQGNDVARLESGQKLKDNQLLQRIERKLGIWFTGDSARIGSPIAKRESKKSKKERMAREMAEKDTHTKQKIEAEPVKENVDSEECSEEEKVAEE